VGLALRVSPFGSAESASGGVLGGLLCEYDADERRHDTSVGMPRWLVGLCGLMGSVPGEPTYRRRADLLVRTAPGFVAICRRDGHNVSLTGTGAAVWELLDRGRTVNDLVVSLASVYDADGVAIAGDVAPLLQRLVDEGFVTVDG
jgi:hypothetical protein